ncbi:hypothetical protein GCM10025767_20910 [Thalassotalea piscium]|uniref:Uncharacterized protein n=2 Tax=Thalassotalea piscium TaxID=1230533 RepID=A0A7X0TTC5_9GAMM|nr:hypothetical protein [Thalassotalea piscium]MBB6543107.1 hypothetical protein [Thalassotalea piscium]
MDVVNQYSIEEVFKHFNLFFLSAKYGLVYAKEVISPYDLKLSTDPNIRRTYVASHRLNVQKVLSSVSGPKVELYTVLFKNYQQVFDDMDLSALKKFKCVYHSKGAAGIGVHRSRLKKILHVKINSAIPPIHYRSGCSNIVEFIGYRAANQAIGASLAYINKKGVLQNILDVMKSQTPLFLDNGMITAHTKGYELSISTVVKQYKELVSGYRGVKNLSIVIPDDPTSQLATINTLRLFKDDIKYLGRKCHIIIPFHKPLTYSVIDQARRVIEVLGSTPFTIGIPCRNKGSNNWRLSITDIEQLFSFKRPNGKPLSTRVHFLALSEVSRGNIYAERLALAQMYEMAFYADCTRTTALFGSNDSHREGSVIARQVHKEVTKENTMKSLEFIEYDGESEIDTSTLWDLIQGMTSLEKAQLWNKCYPTMPIDREGDDEIEEVFENLTSCYFHYFISEAKHVLYQLFTMPNHEPSHLLKRSEAITRYFTNKQPDQMRVPVQQVIGF